MNTESDPVLVLALPKGRIGEELISVLDKAGIEPEDGFFDPQETRLSFKANGGRLILLQARSFDVATFVAFGAAQLGIAGRDVLMEFDYDEIYTPVDLKIGQCRMVVAEPENLVKQDDPALWSHIRVATKYPSLTRRFFADRSVQAECVKLHGSVELAPSLGLCRRIVDLVSTGQTLKDNHLVEVETIAEITSCLIVNRAALKTRRDEISFWIDRFGDAVHAEKA